MKTVLTLVKGFLSKFLLLGLRFVMPKKGVRIDIDGDGKTDLKLDLVHDTKGHQKEE